MHRCSRLLIALLLCRCNSSGGQEHVDATVSESFLSDAGMSPLDQNQRSDSGRPDSALAVQQIYVSGAVACALREDSSLWCWGSNPHQLLSASASPIQITVPHQMQDACPARTLGLGLHHLCISCLDDTTVCKGLNLDGELGDGTETDSSVLRPIELPSRILSFSLGISVTYALSQNSEIWHWGDSRGDAFPRYPRSSNVPMLVNSGPILQVAFSPVADFGCMVNASRHVLCWGYADFGEVGRLRASWTDPWSVPGLDDVRHIAVGKHHVCALRMDESVYCWGLDDVGQLGMPSVLVETCRDNSSQPAAPCSHEPIRVPGLTEVVQLEAGRENTCAVRRDGSVWCWGRNDHWQVGPSLGESCTELGGEWCPVSSFQEESKASDPQQQSVWS